jgi:hypothetical protein
MGASGVGMEFGGYGSVLVPYKEVMCRQFDPVLQDGQIGVDRDTMIMYDADYLRVGYFFLSFAGGSEC